MIVFLLAFVFWSALFSQFPVLYDTDSYFHLAIGRAYAQEGVIGDLPWARFSLLHEGFGDKEFLFHALLAPFARAPFPTLGGRLALAFMNALLTAALAALGMAALGRWGLAVPLLVYVGSEAFLGRAVRLRPELLALLLLVAAIVCVARGRYHLLGLVTMLFTLSYTAFHALLGLCVGWFVERGWIDRHWDPRIVLYPVLGAGLGLLVHPHFPHNLVVWKVQSFDFFAQKGELDVGREIGPSTSDDLLLLNLAWGLGLLVLIWAARRASQSETSTSEAARMAQTQHLATAAFGLLYLLMGRFSLYFIPFAALSVVWELRRRDLSIGSFLPLPGRGKIPVMVAFLTVALVGLARTGSLVWGMANARGGELTREEDWAAFGRATPDGARVAAEWGSGQLYLFWAPQARYLNVLDPIFMAFPYPRAHAVLRDVFEGREPDPAATLEAELDSDHLAVSRFHRHPDLLRRLADDPRWVKLYDGYTLLFAAPPGRNREFALDWRLVPAGTDLPVAAALPAAVDIGEWPAYPRASLPAARSREGFVDGDRVDPRAECLAFARLEELTAPERRFYEFAPWGPSTLWLDGRQIVSTAATSRAFVGRGLHFEARLGPGSHGFTVLTCRGTGAEQRLGFYLRRLTAPTGL